MFKRPITIIVIICLISSYCQPLRAFGINELPVPGSMVEISRPFVPLSLKGLVIDPQKPLQFQFIVDTGQVPGISAQEQLKSEADRLVKYFLAGLTIPEGELWVNLSPYEKDRIVPQALGQTGLGRDLLAQDYILKQLTASMIYPEKELGKQFWSKVYSLAQQRFGTTNVPVNTFNKVWILPDEAQVFEHGSAAYVTKATLKVMIDEDYLAFKRHRENGQDPNIKQLGSSMIRAIILPEIAREVNTGKNFAPLRQVYEALILAKWYKQTIQNGLLDALYTNKDKISGIDLQDRTVKEQIYQRYLQAYKKGVFNYIKEDEALVPDSEGKEGVMPRKYFSGGITNIEPPQVRTDGDPSAINAQGQLLTLKMDLERPRDHAMLGFIKKMLPGRTSTYEDEMINGEMADIDGVMKIKSSLLTILAREISPQADGQRIVHNLLLMAEDKIKSPPDDVLRALAIKQAFTRIEEKPLLEMMINPVMTPSGKLIDKAWQMTGLQKTVIKLSVEGKFGFYTLRPVFKDRSDAAMEVLPFNEMTFTYNGQPYLFKYPGKSFSLSKEEGIFRISGLGEKDGPLHDAFVLKNDSGRDLLIIKIRGDQVTVENKNMLWVTIDNEGEILSMMPPDPRVWVATDNPENRSRAIQFLHEQADLGIEIPSFALGYLNGELNEEQARFLVAHEEVQKILDWAWLMARFPQINKGGYYHFREAPNLMQNDDQKEKYESIFETGRILPDGKREKVLLIDINPGVNDLLHRVGDSALNLHERIRIMAEEGIATPQRGYVDVPDKNDRLENIARLLPPPDDAPDAAMASFNPLQQQDQERRRQALKIYLKVARYQNGRAGESAFDWHDVYAFMGKNGTSFVSKIIEETTIEMNLLIDSGLAGYAKEVDPTKDPMQWVIIPGQEATAASKLGVITNQAMRAINTDERSAVDIKGRISVVQDETAMAREAADRFVNAVKLLRSSMRTPVMGVGTGTTIGHFYNALISRFTNDPTTDLSDVVLVAQDEYLGLGENHSQSYRYFIVENLIKKLNVIDPKRAIKMENLITFTGNAVSPDWEIDRMVTRIRRLGGIDWQLLAGGLDGHFAFVTPAVKISSMGSMQGPEILKELRDRNEIVIDKQGISFPELLTWLKEVLRIREKQRRSLAQQEDVIDQAVSSRLIFLGVKQEPPGLRVKIKEELTALGERMLLEQRLTVYLSPSPSISLEGLPQALPPEMKGKIIFKDRKEFWTQPAKTVDLTLSLLLPNSRFFSSLQELPLKAYTLAGLLLQAGTIEHICFNGKMTPVLGEMLSGPLSETNPFSILPRQKGRYEAIFTRSIVTAIRNSASPSDREAINSALVLPTAEARQIVVSILSDLGLSQEAQRFSRMNRIDIIIKETELLPGRYSKLSAYQKGILRGLPERLDPAMSSGVVFEKHLALPAWTRDFVKRFQNVQFKTLTGRMRVAVELSRLNVVNKTGGPFGAAIFDRKSGQLVSVGVNRVVPQNASLAHAEMMAILMAQESVGSFTLDQKGEGLELVTSAQPCAQCFGAIPWSGVKSVLIAARGEDVESIVGFDEGPIHPQWQRELEKRGIQVHRDVLRQEAIGVLNMYVHQGGVVYNAQVGRKDRGSRKDAAQMVQGGIDLDQINVKSMGRKVSVYFDPAELDTLSQGGFKGFMPVLTDFQYIKSPYSLLGVDAPR